MVRVKEVNLQRVEAELVSQNALLGYVREARDP